MAKKTLKEKIKRVVWIFSTCTLAYIVFGLLLLNEYSRAAVFDAKKVYDVIKDALTLAATFLAPVAAFVLFSDWREQHSEIRDEKVSSTIYTDLMEYRSVVFDNMFLMINLTSEDLNNKNKIFDDMRCTHKKLESTKLMVDKLSQCPDGLKMAINKALHNILVAQDLQRRILKEFEGDIEQAGIMPIRLNDYHCEDINHIYTYLDRLHNELLCIKKLTNDLKI